MTHWRALLAVAGLSLGVAGLSVLVKEDAICLLRDSLRDAVYASGPYEDKNESHEQTGR